MIDRKQGDALFRSSINTLRKVQVKKGGCLAAPPGHRYPYIYPRDNAVCIQGFTSAGLFKEAKRSIRFILDTQQPTGAFPQRVDSDGKDASYKPIQVDGTAMTLFSVAAYAESSKDLKLVKENWETLESAAEYIIKSIHPEKDLVFTPNSIHEFPPMEEGLELWANSTCLGALDMLYRLSKDTGNEKPRWLESAVMIRNGIKNYMWNPRVKCFVKNIRIRESSSVENDPDASILGLCEYGGFADSDPMISSSIRRMESVLWHKRLGGLCRYPKNKGRNNGGWGPWTHFTLMLARHYLRLKNLRQAERCISWVIRNAWKNKLAVHIATKKEFEEYVTDFESAGILRKDRLILVENTRKHPTYKNGIAYATLPLAWPHAEFISTWNLYKKMS